MTRLSITAQDELRDAVRKVDVLWDQLRRGEQDVQRLGDGLYVAKTGGTAITAASGSTVGSGTVTLQELDVDAGTLGNITMPDGSAVTVTAYNFVETASATNAFVFVVKTSDSKGRGIYWLVAEAC